ncbi:tricarballylate utilization 4Fe-4S protein TcuB [Roseovarius sp. 2305UL8-3]|uniref:tricarballylate utilization 4Fe-4S protein TcuB n=1 Tax=Roseovarius conchicola TaxID=3121636 RepID=UPI0035279C9E
MSLDTISEARRQIDICNACRYCEGFCSVFPAINRERVFPDGDITQLANLCHNCQGCYHACQYTAPHEFDLNLPRILAEVRNESWQDHAFPAPFARLFHRSGVAVSLALALGVAVLFWLIQNYTPEGGTGFYAVLSHNLMVALFAPAFLAPLAVIAISLHRYWRTIGGTRLRWRHIVDAFHSAAQMKNLAGGHGEGCNFEDEDRFSNARRYAHQATMYGFLLCFAATASGTILHYGFDMHAPYGLFSLPKLFGIPGGILLSLGTLELLRLKLKSNKTLTDARNWGGEVGFVVLLHLVSTSGLALYAFGATAALSVLLALHLGLVLAFFVLTPYSKMMHGFFRLAALMRDAQKKEG